MKWKPWIIHCHMYIPDTLTLYIWYMTNIRALWLHIRRLRGRDSTVIISASIYVIMHIHSYGLFCKLYLYVLMTLEAWCKPYMIIYSWHWRRGVQPYMIIYSWHWRVVYNLIWSSTPDIGGVVYNLIWSSTPDIGGVVYNLIWSPSPDLG
jgi:hypothetical protein